MLAAMADGFLAAVVQVRGTTDLGANETTARELVSRAAADGARFIALPENWFFIGPLEEKVTHAEPLEGPRVRRMQDLAAKLGVHLLLGSIAEVAPNPAQCFNTSVLLGPTGELLASYRKIHLFDVDIPDGAVFQESETVAEGDQGLTVVETPLARFGLSVCYDLRFPEMYRALVADGAQVLAVPSAFTMFTGKDHWEVLLRARAIENTSWVIAPNHSGAHSKGRTSYGRSMIIDPWGTVVANCSDGPGYAVARIDMGLLDRVRKQIPSLGHRRL